jgi:hypothetical protein
LTKSRKRFGVRSCLFPVDAIASRYSTQGIQKPACNPFPPRAIKLPFGKRRITIRVRVLHPVRQHHDPIRWPHLKPPGVLSTFKSVRNIQEGPTRTFISVLSQHSAHLLHSTNSIHVLYFLTDKRGGAGVRPCLLPLNHGAALRGVPR